MGEGVKKEGDFNTLNTIVKKIQNYNDIAPKAAEAFARDEL